MSLRGFQWKPVPKVGGRRAMARASFPWEERSEESHSGSGGRVDFQPRGE